jgi:hypothetical protein
MKKRLNEKVNDEEDRWQIREELGDYAMHRFRGCETRARSGCQVVRLDSRLERFPYVFSQRAVFRVPPPLTRAGN